jgi:hypothetical protein
MLLSFQTAHKTKTSKQRKQYKQYLSRREQNKLYYYHSTQINLLHQTQQHTSNMMIKTSHSTFVLVTAAALLSSPVTASDDFQRGFNQGQQSAESIWHNNDGQDCSNISNFQRQINQHINNTSTHILAILIMRPSISTKVPNKA